MEDQENLLREKEAVYAAIKDLDFEYKTGKLSDEDYAALRESYRVRALNILKRINEPEEEAAGLDAEAETAPAAESGTAPQGVPPGSTEAAVREARQVLSCAQCGEANPRGSKFCSVCGTPLETEVTCSNCGTARSLSDHFCPVCGHPSNSPN